MGQILIINLEQKEEIVANIYYHWSAYTCASINESENIIDAIDSEGINEDSTLPEIISAIRTHAEASNINISERMWMRKNKKGFMPVNLHECLEIMESYFATDNKNVFIQAGMNTNIPDEIEEACQIILRKGINNCKILSLLMEVYTNITALSEKLDKNNFYSKKEKDCLLKIYTYEFSMNRNCGLISVSPKDMEESFYWGEERVDINIDDKMICNTVNFVKDDFEEYSSLEEALEKKAEFPVIINGEIYDYFWGSEEYRKVPKAKIEYVPLYEETTFEQYREEAQIYIDFYDEGIYEFQVGNLLVQMIE